MGDRLTKIAAGDVIFAAATHPRLDGLFSPADVVVTDRGTPAAHAALVATHRITDGTHVTVDAAEGSSRSGDS